MNEETLELLSANDDTLYIAADVSSAEWVLALGARSKLKPMETRVDAWDVEALAKCVEIARQRFELGDSSVVFAYEAGRDGFSIHRRLTGEGYLCLVIDPASVEVSRRSRRAKTDRLDARKLLAKLRNYVFGDRDVLAVVRVPALPEEDARRPSRELTRLSKERSQHRTRINSVLATIGVSLPLNSDFCSTLQSARTPYGEPIPTNLKKEVLRELERLELVEHQMGELEDNLKASITAPVSEVDRQAAALVQLRGIGPVTAMTLPREFFWRQFRNRKEVGAAAGLTGTPRATGTSTDQEQGISKAGNGRVRTLMLEIAWSWVRLQPDSPITAWYRAHVVDGVKRSKRKAIVAVARRLLIALWRYATQGIVPEGALFNGTAYLQGA